MKTLGLNESYFISNFLTGLNEELRGVLYVHKPSTIQEAFEVARGQEFAFEAMTKSTKLWLKRGYSSFCIIF